MREWLTQVELAEAKLQGSGIEVAEQTARGLLRQELERWMNTQVARNAVTWPQLRAHLRTAFLSQNENERLQAELGRTTRVSGEGYLAYNRRFREAASRAYPLPRQALAEHLVVQAYAKGLDDVHLARKVMENNPATLQAAITLVENRVAGIERFKDLGLNTNERKEEAMDTTLITNTPPSTSDSVSQKLLEELKRTRKGLERLQTKVDNLEKGRTRVSDCTVHNNDNHGRTDRQVNNRRTDRQANSALCY